MRGSQWRALAITTIVALAFAGCGGDQGAENAGEEGTTPAAGAPEAEAPAQAPAQAPEQGLDTANLPAGVTAAQVAEGRQIFTGQGICYTCHGPDAKGTQLAPDLTDDEWLQLSGRNLDEIEQLIRTGVPNPAQHPSPMPPMGGANLTDEQVRAVAAYVASLGQG